MSASRFAAARFELAARLVARAFNHCHSLGRDLSHDSILGTKRNNTGLSEIDPIAAATSTFCPASGIKPYSYARSERMKENSPIWASPMATVSAVRVECPKSATIASAASGLASRIIPSAATTIHGSDSRKPGSTSIPTETKNSTEKASRSGSASAAAWWLTGDCPTTIPARNAPSAIDAPKK